jgi:hypothetical protein
VGCAGGGFRRLATVTSLGLAVAWGLAVLAWAVGDTSLVEEDGVGVLAFLAIPLVAALVAAASVWRRHLAIAWVAAGVLAAMMILGAFTIGTVFAPSLLTVAVACALNTGFGRAHDTGQSSPPNVESHPTRV